MPVYRIILTDVEQKAMEYISTDVNFWIQNAVHERARLAIEELAANHISAKLAAGESVSGTKEEIVMKSDLPNAVARNEEAIKLMMTR
jgi:ABC-type branched-subunit amino acid transport system substrate-binding protein